MDNIALSYLVGAFLLGGLWLLSWWQCRKATAALRDIREQLVRRDET